MRSGASRSKIVRSEHAGPFTVTESLYAAHAEMPPHRDSTPHLSFVVGGSLTELAKRRRHECVAGSLVYKPTGVLHADRIGRVGARILKVEFPRGHGDDVRRYAWFHGGPHISFACRIYRQLCNQPATSTVLERLCEELLDAVQEQPRREQSSAHAPSWLERCVELVHERFAEGLRVRALATELGVHPVYLARAFRRRFRCSVGEYVRRLRVERAMCDLAQTAHPVVQIALSSGFSDQSHLTRVFKAHTGFTPNSYRLLAAPTIRTESRSRIH